MRPTVFLALAALASAAACGPAEEAGEPPSSPGDGVAAARGEQATTAGLVVTANGVGPARPGMTLAELRAAGQGAEFRYVQDYRDDLSALCARDGDGELYCAGVERSPSEKADAEASIIFTSNPRARTVQGVGPGTPVAAAEAVYGRATFFYSTETGSREYAEFVDGPASNIAFRVTSPTSAAGFAGVYGPAPGPFFETERYVADAVIRGVEVTRAASR